MPHALTTPDRTTVAAITHTTVVIVGDLESDVAAYHARTAEARIRLTVGATLMTIYSCQAAQGLLEAFAAARAAMAQLPRQLAIPVAPAPQSSARTTVGVEWTRRPAYAVLAQCGPTKPGSAVIHWLDLCCGPITFQIRDQAGLRNALEVFTKAHRTAIAVCLDGPDYAADPTADDYPLPG